MVGEARAPSSTAGEGGLAQHSQRRVISSQAPACRRKLTPLEELHPLCYEESLKDSASKEGGKSLVRIQERTERCPES